MERLGRHPGRRQACLAIALLAGWGAGCVGSGVGVPAPADPGGAAPRTYLEIQANIFEPTCAAQCHRGGAAPKGLSLESNRVLREMINVASVEVPELLRIAPGEPDASYLIVKLVASDPKRVGGRMPRNGPPYLSSAQIGAIRRWIRAGASDDWEDGDEVDAAVVPRTPGDGGAEMGDGGAGGDGDSK